MIFEIQYFKKLLSRQLQLCHIQVLTVDNVHTMVQRILQPIYYRYLTPNYQNYLVSVQ